MSAIKDDRQDLKYLYHGSMYSHDTLRPGFYYTKKEVNWDETESNRFLYASSIREDSIDQGFASALEQKFQIVGYKSSPGEILIFSDPNRTISQTDLKSIVIYVYKIKYTPSDGWVKNNNQHNNLLTEWKTKNTIPEKNIEARIRIPIGEHLAKLVTERTKEHIKITKVQLNQLGLESLDLSSSALFEKW